MNSEEIAPILNQQFPDATVKHETKDTWQVDQEQMHLLVILSEDGSWLRILLPIASAAEAQSLLTQLLVDNFDVTQQARYALSQGVLWGVFHHRLASLTTEDFISAIATLVALLEKGLTEPFNQLIEQRIRQIIQAAKQQGQSLEATYQTLDRFYQEGMLGGVDQDPKQREQFLAAWKYQLQRLWSEVEV
ncbi:hypothetical protein [Myxosarcina sp. GI1(2024)]